MSTRARKEQAEAGFRAMARHRATVCGLARNCARRLPALLAKLDRMASLFGECRFIVIENDSVDQTGTLLKDWAHDDPRVELVQLCLLHSPDSGAAGRGVRRGEESFSIERIERMSYLRNGYIERLGTLHGDDIVMVVDFDIHGFSIEGIAHTLGSGVEWDCVAANCLRFSPRHPFHRHVYWDTYAYEPENGFPGGALDRSSMLKAQVSLPVLLRKEALLPVRSAFGGLALYRAEAIRGRRYSTEPNEDSLVNVLSEHIGLHRDMAAAGHSAIFINRRQTVVYESSVSVLTRLLGFAPS